MRDVSGFGVQPVPPSRLSLLRHVRQDVIYAVRLLPQYWLLPTVIFGICGTLLLPSFGFSSSNLIMGASLVVLLVGLVSVKEISDEVAALAFFLVAIGIFALPPEVAFAGFHANSSWLILAGMILGAALKDSGLTNRIAERILGANRFTYSSIISALAVLSLVLAFLMPSTAARVLLLVPIVIALADRLGYRRESKGFTGMIIAISVLSFLPCTGIMTSNVRNLGVIGAAQSLYGIEFSYTDFLLWNFPVLSLFLTGMFSLLIIWRYGESPHPTEKPQLSNAFSAKEKGVLAIALCTLMLWMTDFAHGLPPAWVGLAAAALCLYGPSRDLPLSEQVKLGGWLIFVAFIGLAAIISHTGLGNWLGGILVDHAGFGIGRTAWNLGAVTVIGIVVGLVATNFAGPVVMASLAGPIAEATGWSVQGTIIAMMPSWSFFPFAYQAPIILVAMRMANVPLKELNICLLLITVIALLVIVPLQFIWLWALGLIG